MKLIRRLNQVRQSGKSTRLGLSFRTCLQIITTSPNNLTAHCGTRVLCKTRTGVFHEVLFVVGETGFDVGVRVRMLAKDCMASIGG